MPTVKYNIYKNSITKPPSYYPKVEPRTIHGLDDIAGMINEKNPSVPVETAKTIINAFRQVALSEVANGNTVKIANFFSMQPKLSGKMVAATDPLPTDSFSVNVVVAAPFQTEIAQAATFERVGVVAISPSVASTLDTNLGIENLVREGYGFQVDGARMGWDQTDTDLGVFLISSNATIRQTNISYNKAKKAILTPVLDSGISSPNVEYTLQVRNRYTENGQVRTGTYTSKVRTVNVISDATTDQVLAIGAGTGPGVLDYTGAQVDARIVALIDPALDVVKVKIGDIEGNFGPEETISAAGTVTLTGLATDVDFTVADYSALYANILSYGRYMEEVIDLSPLTP